MTHNRDNSPRQEGLQNVEHPVSQTSCANLKDSLNQHNKWESILVCW